MIHHCLLQLVLVVLQLLVLLLQLVLLLMVLLLLVRIIILIHDRHLPSVGYHSYLCIAHYRLVRCTLMWRGRRREEENRVLLIGMFMPQVNAEITVGGKTLPT